MTSPGQGPFEFEREILQVLSEAGLKLGGQARVLPYDIMIDTAPRVYVVCKARVHPHDLFEAIGRALYRQHAVPDARAVVAVPYRGRFFEQLSGFFEKYDIPVATPDTIVDTIAKLTKPSSSDPARDVGLEGGASGVKG
jgi:hypothetical protein